MRTICVVLLLVFAACAFGSYTFYFTDPMSSLQTSYWTTAGAAPQFNSYSGYYGGQTGPSGGQSTMVSSITVPDGSSYEVNATVRFPGGTVGGNFTLLLRSSTTFDSFGRPLTADYVNIGCGSSGFIQVVSDVNSVNTVMNLMYGNFCSDGMTVSAVVRSDGQISTYVNGVFQTWAQDTNISSGKPGIMLPFYNSGMVISQVQLGPPDTVAPGPIPTNGLTYSVFANHVDFQWQPVPDDANGVGVGLYQFLRDDNWVENTTSLSWSDATVQPGTEYTYTFNAYDRFFNVVSQSVTITTPTTFGNPPNPPDGRRVGIRSNGAYWGASTEQIDLLSGNLNYTVPLLKAIGRAGQSATFSLNYNSQNWRSNGNGTETGFGEDVGYGYGWRLLAGSLTPVWANQYTIAYYLYVDSTGAEYRLDRQNGSVYTSAESIYVSFDREHNKLYFRDGSFWVMGW